MKAILSALRLVLNDRSLWPYIWKPWLWSTLIFLAIFFGGYAWFTSVAAQYASQLGFDRGLGTSLGTVLYVLLWIALSGILFLSITSLLSAFLWDKLSAAVEEKISGRAALLTPPLVNSLVDSIIRIPFSIFIALSTFCCGLFCVPLSVLLAGWLGLYDYTACAYLRRNIGFGKQFTRAFRCKEWPTFLLCAGLLTLIPFINTLALPVLVAAGTIMVLETEKI